MPLFFEEPVPRHAHGRERNAAILQADRYQVRPMLMTAFAFVAGRSWPA